MGSISLRDYQLDLIQRTRAALSRHKRVLLQAPTGAGKTALATFIAEQTLNKGKTVYFICHRAELIFQTSQTFSRYGIAHGIIAAGYRPDSQNTVQICSIDTLKNRLAGLAVPSLVIWDECHHIAAAGWSAVMTAWASAYHVGLSATPVRLDGQGLDSHFDDMVLGPKVSWLIERGFLASFALYAPSVPDMKGVSSRGGDFSRGESAERMSKPKLIGDAISHWREYADGLKTVAFCVNVKHSQYVVETFNGAGIRSAHLDGGTPKGERRDIIQAYAGGELEMLSNVGLFGEGFDLSAIAQRDVTIDAIIDLNPTQSLSWCLQKWGRALRPSAGKTAVILDHAGNTARHGFPDDDREWTLSATEKRSKNASDGPPPPATCETCFRQIRRPLPPTCPTCGTSLAGKAREIEQDVEQKLGKVDEEHKRKVREQLKREQGQCQTIGALLAFAQKQGYASPMAWAQKVFSGRKRKR